jgi:acyl-coenzyme A thioesterase PaaI-like protein
MSGVVVPPEGFERHSRRSGLTDPWEPIYVRRAGSGALRLGLVADTPHANSRGFVHGGLITALADNAMGLLCGEEVRTLGHEVSGLLTVSLAVDFVGSAKIGQWLEFRPELVRAGRSLCFGSAMVVADEAACARASAVFKVLAAR